MTVEAKNSDHLAILGSCHWCSCYLTHTTHPNIVLEGLTGPPNSTEPILIRHVQANQSIEAIPCNPQDETDPPPTPRCWPLQIHCLEMMWQCLNRREWSQIRNGASRDHTFLTLPIDAQSDRIFFFHSLWGGVVGLREFPSRLLNCSKIINVIHFHSQLCCMFWQRHAGQWQYLQLNAS